jgi:hypothetical protein
VERADIGVLEEAEHAETDLAQRLFLDTGRATRKEAKGRREASRCARTRWVAAGLRRRPCPNASAISARLGIGEAALGAEPVSASFAASADRLLGKAVHRPIDALPH